MNWSLQQVFCYEVFVLDYIVGLEYNYGNSTFYRKWLFYTVGMVILSSIEWC